MRLRLVAWLVAFSLVPPGLLACSCYLPPLEELVAQSHLVAQVRVLEGKELGEARRYQVELEATKVWKGEVGDRFQLQTPREGTFCDLDLVDGGEYLVFATTEGDHWFSGVCSGTRPIRTDLPTMDPRGKLDTLLAAGAIPETKIPAAAPMGGPPVEGVVIRVTP